MNNNTLRKILTDTEGKFFTVTFLKKDGSIRTMNCRTGVKKYLKGGTSTTAHCPNLVTVYDVQAKGYRCINLDTVMQVKVDGLEFNIAQ